jgi:adenosylhomocysteine nucleosidase
MAVPLSGSDKPRLAPAPVAADVGIVMALPIEAGYLCDSLTKVRKYTARKHTIVEGELGDKIVAVVLSGAGRKAARLGAEMLIAGHRPSWLFSAGFAGGLDPALARNDLVIPDQVVDSEGNQVDIDTSVFDLPETVRTRGRLLTMDRIIASSAEKAKIRQEHQADLIDMESSALALIARERLLRFLSVRVISDEASTELPPEIASMLAHTGSYRAGAALRALWQRPGALKDFWTLHARALESADRLASCIRRLIETLPGAFDHPPSL